MENKIIGLVGFIGSGKGTVGDYLSTNHGYVPRSFASSLKDAVSAIYAWPRHLLEGDTAESRAWRELPDPYWSRKMGRDVTPRWILQYVGTDVFRNHFHDQTWIWSLEKKLAESSQNVVITDVRFPNEIEMVRALGGAIWWVRRQPEPSWIGEALQEGSGSLRYRSDVHPSEYEWVRDASRLATVIDNNGSITDLHSRIEEALLNGKSML